MQDIPSPSKIAMYSAVGLSIVHLGLHLISDLWSIPPILEITLFVLLCFSLLYWGLKWLVFRRLQDEDVLKQQEIQKLKAMEAFRREFLGDVSHELKTPIFAVQGFIHTLLDGAINDEKVNKKFLKKAMKNADRLSSLVQDLLIITQIESGEMEMTIRKFSIHELVIDVVDSLSYKFTKKGRDIQCRVEPNGLADTIVFADRERIQQVLTNLVDNAIKYGNPEGEVEIELMQEESKLWILVKDNGPGIGEEHLDKLFRRFYRVDKSRSRGKGGTGLGLAICKHLIEAHDETIKVKSEEGDGSTFMFSLQKAD